LQPLRTAADVGARVTLGGVLFLTLLAATASWIWLGDLFVHFRPQYVLAAALASAVLFALGRRMFALVALALVAVNVALWVLAFRPGDTASTTLVARAEAGPATAGRAPLTLKVAASNVFFGNEDPTRVIAWVQAERPDIISFEEVTPAFLAALESLAADYPHRLQSNTNGRFGTVLFSRYPFEESRLLGVAENRDREIATAIRVGERRIRVVAVHATWPYGPAMSSIRNQELGALTEYARAHPEPVILLGDFNITPFSPHFRNLLLDEARLHSAAAGFGWQPTWPTFLPVAGIQIDHILVSQDIRVRNFRRGPRVGSDHWPIVAELLVP
jgi:endonuclease/exonuclease/phosphatase (EEP) superfamily protein YafD